MVTVAGNRGGVGYVGDHDDDPYYDPYCDADALDCYHEQYEIDVWTSRAECQICGHRWWATDEQVNAELDRIAEYDKWASREDRRQWWRDKLAVILAPFYRLRRALLRAKEDDDDLPF